MQPDWPRLATIILIFGMSRSKTATAFCLLSFYSSPLNRILVSASSLSYIIIKYIKFVILSDRSMRRWTEENKQLVIDTLSDGADGM